MSSILEDTIKKFHWKKNISYMNAMKRNRDLQILISSWDSDIVTWNMPDEDPPEDPKALWEWLWRGAVIDEDALTARAGVIFGKGMLNMAILLRMIYPDGTRHPLVDKFLNDSKLADLSEDVHDIAR